MISGVHMIVYSTDAEADRAFFHDVLKLPSVDAGDGWLIFALPPAEIAAHPAVEGSTQEIYLMCDDISATVRELKSKKVECGEMQNQGWGLLTTISLPSGGSLGLYEPRHPVPPRIAAV